MGELRRAWQAWRGLSWRGKAGTAAVILVVGAALAPSDPVPQDDGVAVQSADEPTPEGPAATADPGPTPRSPSPTPTPTGVGPRGDDPLALRSGVAVTNVVDGDTVDLADGTRVRLAIVDTPEVHNGVEACGPEASAFTRDLVLGESVTILRPSAAPVTDAYDRLVGEVVRDRDGASLNVALAGAGLGEVDERYTHEDPDLADRARAAAGAAPTPSCAAAVTPLPATPPPAPARPSEPAPGGGAASHTGRTDGGWACHPAYRECLPAGAGDLDCADVGHQVVLLGDDDPWRLDGNSTTRQDGVGCDTYPAWSPGTAYPYG